MMANPILLQKKYSRVIECFAKKQGLSLDEALDFFYHSVTYQLMREGISDMHCMSDLYLADELQIEYTEQYGKRWHLEKGLQMNFSKYIKEVWQQNLMNQIEFVQALGVSYLMFLGEKQAYKVIESV